MRKLFIDNFAIGPPIIRGNQMPFHRNVSASQKTFKFICYDTDVKENYTLSSETVTVYTQVNNDPIGSNKCSKLSLISKTVSACSQPRISLSIFSMTRVFVGIDGGIIGDIQLNETYIRN